MKNLLLSFMLAFTILNSAVSQDWANLSRYAAENKSIGSPQHGEKRVIFMGNSITEGWLKLDPDFFKGRPFICRGISGQTTPQMLVRFRQDVIELKTLCGGHTRWHQ